MLNRRRLLALGGVLGSAAMVQLSRTFSAGATEPAGPHHSDLDAMLAAEAPAGPSVAVDPFTVRMPVPSELRPVVSLRDRDIYHLPIQPANVELLPGVQTPALTYGGRFVGPTIRASTGRRVQVYYSNRLDMPANVHLHGGHVPASHDGHPMDVIEPGAWRLYDYPNTQQGATLWYHDHSHHMEAEHVYRGLHGFYLIDDEDERHLRLPRGEYDVPIMLRDAQFDTAGAMVFGPASGRTTTLVNGRPQPYFPVAARKYRLRLLNGASQRVFRLNLGGQELVQIASDGGLLPAPVPRTELTLTSAERCEVVIDFGRYPVGTQLVLADATAGPLMRFDVVRRAGDNSRLPDELRPLPALPAATVERDVLLNFGLAGGVTVGMINGRTYDPTVTDFQVQRGTTEIWRVTNGDPFPHNFHMHLVQFQVLDRGTSPATVDDAGRKDTVFLPARTTVRVQATFGDHLGKYVYHCHFLDHSARGMMAQMEVVA